MLTAALRLSLRCRRGTPPNSQKAFCNPSDNASNDSEAQTLTDSQFESVSTKWYTRWSNGWPAMVTPNAVMLVKSEAPRSPAA